MGWPYLTLKKTNIHMTRKKPHFPSPIQNNIRVIMTPQSGRSAEAITETRRLLCSRHSGTAVVHHAMISLNEASHCYWVIVLVYSSTSPILVPHPWLAWSNSQSTHMCKHAVCAHNTMQPLWCWGFQLVYKKNVCNGRRRDGRGTT